MAINSKIAVLLAALIFINFVLAIAATIFAVKAVSHEVLLDNGASCVDHYQSAWRCAEQYN
jgi:hypothetical protein